MLANDTATGSTRVQRCVLACYVLFVCMLCVCVYFFCSSFLGTRKNGDSSAKAEIRWMKHVLCICPSVNEVLRKPVCKANHTGCNCIVLYLYICVERRRGNPYRVKDNAMVENHFVCGAHCCVCVCLCAARALCVCEWMSIEQLPNWELLCAYYIRLM